MSRILVPVFIACLILAGCSRTEEERPSSPITLATWYESKVGGEIRLVWNGDGQTWIEAVFIPEAGCHLYSKDLPKEGLDGLGRPTLIEVVPGGAIVAGGEIFASVTPIPDEGVPGLFVYPAGEVRLSLPIVLPQGGGWYDEQIAITYMACKQGRCYPPVEAKILPVRLPGNEERGSG